MSDRYLTAYDLVDAEAREAWVRERDDTPDPINSYNPADSCPRCGRDTFCDCEDR